MSRRLKMCPNPGARLLAVFLSLLSFLGAPRAAAQSRSPQESREGPEAFLRSELELGEPLRLTLWDGTRQERRLGGLTEQSLLVFGNSRQRGTSFRYAQIREIERRVRGNPGEGFLLGGTIGIGVVLLATVIAIEATDDNAYYGNYSGLVILIYAPLGFAVGAITGLVLGSQSHWESVYHVERNPGDSVKPGYSTPVKKTSPLAVGVGAAIGVAAGAYLAQDQDRQGEMPVYAMAGLTVGAIAGGLLGTRTVQEAEWQKLSVAPLKGGLMLGYSTRF